LDLLHRGHHPDQVAEALQVSGATVFNIKRRYLQEGLDAALVDKPRPGKPPSIDGRMRARITALASAILPERMAAPRKRSKLEPVREFIDLILEADLQAPRKQRHTAHRIFCRLREERSSSEIAERTVSQYVRQRKLELGLSGREVCVLQTYAWGSEAQID
jgi:transposase